MQKSTKIQGAEVFITDEGNLQIGKGGYGFTRKYGPALIQFIQQWLDRDPEQELIEEIRVDLRKPYWPDEQDVKEIIAAVRDHDRKYPKD